jgi:chemotaxis signal transduction protein
MVDEIGDVVTLDRSQFAAVPPTLTGACREIVDGVYTLDERLLLTIDLALLLDVTSVVGSPNELVTA